MRRNRGSSVGGGCRRGKHCTSRVIRGQKSILCQQPPFQTHWTVGLVQRPCPSSQIPDFIPVASQEAVNAEALGQAINFFLPSQDFADSPPEGGWRYLSAFEWDGQYQPVNVLLSRACVIACGVSTPRCGIYPGKPGRLPRPFRCTPVLVFASKGEPPQASLCLAYEGGAIHVEGHTIYIGSNGALSPLSSAAQKLYYCDDEKDRRASG